MTNPEDKHKFSQRAVDCLHAMHDNVFWEPLHTVPWGGRTHVLGRRYILQKYLTNEDILQAYWINEQAKRTDPNWRDTEPGLSHLTKVMNERSGHRWHQEQDDYQKSTPSQMAYMEAEWGSDTRLALAQHRKDEAVRRRAGVQSIATPQFLNSNPKDQEIMDQKAAIAATSETGPAERTTTLLFMRQEGLSVTNIGLLNLRTSLKTDAEAKEALASACTDWINTTEADGTCGAIPATTSTSETLQETTHSKILHCSKQ